MGGFGSAIAECLLDNDILVPLKRFGVPDILVDHASPNESKADLGLTGSQIAEKVLQMFFSKQPSVVG
jgi:1-deoxy-D-xylulose-5-phosphate synthase